MYSTRQGSVAAICGLLLLLLPSFRALASELPRAGLVLWLDAQDAETIDVIAGSAVGTWADKSGQGNHAVQADSAHQPRLATDVLLGTPAVHFDGDDFLNVGQPESLGFQPGDPYTIVVVYHVALKNRGTFLSKGGDVAGQRTFQLYVAPGRQGAIAYGAMHERPRSEETAIVIQVCDGTRVEIDGVAVPKFSFRAGASASNVDVLIGARRQNVDNTGTFYPLRGNIAEILVYNRALSAEERGGLSRQLGEKHGLKALVPDLDSADQFARLLESATTTAQLDLLAKRLLDNPGAAPIQIAAVLKKHPDTAARVAELLAKVAQNNQLTETLTQIAADLLDHKDPFARGCADWAITMRVGTDNNGQQVRWPCVDPPPWYIRWSRLSAEFRTEADWVRQAVSQDMHRDPTKLTASIGDMIQRVQRMRHAWKANGVGADRLTLAGARVAELHRLRDRCAATDLANAQSFWLEARRHLRTVVLGHPSINFDRLVFIKQFAPHTVRNITRSYAWKHKPGGDICILSNLKKGGSISNILDGRLGPGYVWGLDLGWNAERVVFSYARQPNWPPAVDTAVSEIEGTNVFGLRRQHEPLHLFETSVDGSTLRQITDDPYWSDFEPTYCANGDIIFASDRCGRSAECGNDSYDHTNPNLYIVSADGSDLRKWTDSKDIDRYPHSLDDGRIAYTHWEYQERHFMEVHAIWTARPDGTMADALFKHHMRAPCGLRDTRSIPGSNGKLVSIATGHHTFAYGPVMIVDTAQGTNAESGLLIVTPGVKPQEGPMAGRPVAGGGVLDRGGLYQTPWALSEQCFLASYSYARPNCTAPAGADSNGFGLYLIDIFGNRELLHRDPVLSCTSPIPLQKRLRPPILPDLPSEPRQPATCVVANVYDGLDNIPPGTIRYLRISQHVGWPFDAERGQVDYIPGNAGSRRIDFQSWSPVRVIGTVPVEPDGSAHFTVPADKAIYFQALDKRQMEIRRMRSFVSLKSGEVRGCTGCHESRGWTPGANRSMPLAIRRGPDRPAPPAWGSDRLLGFEWLVQPILDRHCVRCHDENAHDGEIDLTATRADDGLLQSYRTMFGLQSDGKQTERHLVSCADRFSNADVTQTEQFGSHKSPLVRVLLDDALHRDQVSLSQDEWVALVTWIDANAPYYDGFINKRPAEGQERRRETFVGDPPRPTDAPEVLRAASGNRVSAE